MSLANVAIAVDIVMFHSASCHLVAATQPVIYLTNEGQPLNQDALIAV